jgi:hypothetical protein
MFLPGLIFVTACWTGALDAQAPASGKPEQWVDQWFVRLNDLGKEAPGSGGKDDNAAFVEPFVQLHAPDAYFQVSPSENQIGPVVYHGHEGIRKWASDFSKRYSDLQYRMEFRTFGEETIEVFYTVPLPGGGTGVSVEFTAVYTDRRDKRRFFGPGAAFFLFDKAGKIQNVRLYILQNEIMELSR